MREDGTEDGDGDAAASPGRGGSILSATSPNGRNQVIGRSKFKVAPRHGSAHHAVTLLPSTFTRDWDGFAGGSSSSAQNSPHAPAPFRRAQTEHFGSPSSPYDSFPPFQRAETSIDLDLATALRRRISRHASLRRMSSFGGAPILIRPPEALKLAITEEGDEEEHVASNLRWLVLGLTCMLLFGNYYAYDNPAALNWPLQKYLGHDYDTWQYELNLLYSVYSFPNMFLPFLGGQLVDKFDIKKILLVFSTIVCLGQTLFAIGVSTKSFPIMLTGRVFFGIGGESIGVVQASITTAWFRGKELAFALGLTLCIARFGSVVNANLSPRIEKIWTSSGAVWVGGLTCYLSFGCAIILVYIMAHHAPDTPGSPGLSTSSRTSSKEDIPPSSARRGSIQDSATTPLLPKSLNCDSPTTTSKEAPAWLEGLAEIAMFPWTFWLVCLICVLLYGTVVPFNNIASDFLMSKWFPGDTQTAGTVMSIPDTMSAVLVPICGVLVDRYGGRASLLVVCALVIAAVHATLGLTQLYPVYPLVFLGLSYSMYGVAIWPSIATVIQHREDTLHHENPNDPPPKLLGTAYGLSTSALNTALTVMPLISAQIRVWGGSFVPVEMFFVALALGGAAASAVLWVVDVKHGSLLQMPEAHQDEDFHHHHRKHHDSDGDDTPPPQSILTDSNYGAIGQSASPNSRTFSPGSQHRGNDLSSSPTTTSTTNDDPTGAGVHHRRPVARFASQPFKPGKAFCAAPRIKTRANLDAVRTPFGDAAGEAGEGRESGDGSVNATFEGMVASPMNEDGPG
ncbi:major facilitator superfamily domain-containing protein [Fimicolochytrium jonesii]|uniref:major facilitator superfamily domain-containing protein n=1 Tax=Fimicolochytrium jonesii TaxID=1396493 RepID=UPI0022FF0BF8|nr:major facilitator superfamily domain-containing protein [Fimicolochytrium jonesii]KAI8821840.1 major facilitator superfamily domain-containing protein [Fimicolochytrium jonesii]